MRRKKPGSPELGPGTALHSNGSQQQGLGWVPWVGIIMLGAAAANLMAFVLLYPE